MTETDSFPHSPTLERSLLASLMLKPHLIPEVCEDFRVEAFYSHRNALIYRAILSLHESTGTSDIKLLSHRLEGQALGLNDVRDVASYLGKIIDEEPRSDNAKHYANELMTLFRKRDALNATTVAQSMIAEPGGAEGAATYLRSVADIYDKTRPRSALGRIDLATILEGEDPVIPWIVEGWLAEEELAQFAGEWATGKSYVALDLALSLAQGLPWMGAVSIPTPLSVLYVDEENTEHTARRRTRRMVRGREFHVEQMSPRFTYLHRNGLNLSSAAGIAELKREIVACGAKVVILDSLVDLIGFDMNDNERVAGFYRELKRVAAEMRVAIIVLDHMRKPGKEDNGHDPAHRIIGGSMKSNIVDETWTLSGDRDKDTRQLSCSKARAGDRRAPTLTTKYEETEDGSACWISASPTEHVSRAVVVGIAATSGDAGIYASDLLASIQARMGVSKTTANRVVAKATDAGDITRQTVGNRVLYHARNGRGESLLGP